MQDQKKELKRTLVRNYGSLKKQKKRRKRDVPRPDDISIHSSGRGLKGKKGGKKRSLQTKDWATGDEPVFTLFKRRADPYAERLLNKGVNGGRKSNSRGKEGGQAIGPGKPRKGDQDLSGFKAATSY